MLPQVLGRFNDRKQLAGRFCNRLEVGEKRAAKVAVLQVRMG